jgi:acyl-CoA reductase-like NAD-dependent aldehyde dehydrogenase
MTVEAQIEKKTLISYDPSDGSIVGEVEIASAENVGAAVERARQAQPAWNARGIRNRLAVIRRFQRILNPKNNKSQL